MRISINKKGILFLTLLSFASCNKAQPSKDIIIVTNEDGNSISIINSDSLDNILTLQIGKRPRGVKLSKSQGFAYMATSGSPKRPPWMDDDVADTMKTDKSQDGIIKFDLNKKQVVDKLPAGSDPEQFDISYDETTLFIANEDSASLSVVDIQTKQVIKKVPVGEEPEGVRTSPDGKLVAVTCEEKGELYLIDTKSYEVKNHAQIGKRPRDIVFEEKGDIIYISSEGEGLIYILNAATLITEHTIMLPPGTAPVGMVLNSKTNRLYVAGGRGKIVVEIDLAQKKVTRTVDVTARPWNIALSTDKKRLYTANGPSDDISVIDIETFKIIKTLKTDKGSWGVAIKPR